ncbi:MAG: radical SAM protein [Bdellovibrionales bacterium]|nr:radical SAM protein [Bdellovibrionales bacterium]
MNYQYLLEHLPQFLSAGGSLLKHYILNSSEPTFIVWSLTNACNLDCSYCGLPHLRLKELEGEDLFRYLDTTIDHGLKVISLTGGEPMVHKDFHEFVLRARSRNVLLSLNTNGILVKKNIDFIKQNFFRVCLSLDGPPEMNDRYRGKNSAKHVLNAILLLKEYKIETNITSVITKSSFDKVEEIVEFGRKQDIPFYFQHVANELLSGLANPDLLTKEEIIQSINVMIRLRNEHNPYILNSKKSLNFLKYLIENPSTVNCKTGKVFARVEPTGDLVRCGRRKEGFKYSQILQNGFYECFKGLQSFSDCTHCTAHLGLAINSKTNYLSI